MKPPARRLALMALVVVAIVGVALDGQEELGGRTRPNPRATDGTSAPVVPPRLSRSQLNRQDRVSEAHRRRETRAFDDRPLLTVLPLELAGVRIDIAGLASNGRSTELIIVPGTRGRAYARALYERALAAYDDSGNAYVIRWDR